MNPYSIQRLNVLLQKNTTPILTKFRHSVKCKEKTKCMQILQTYISITKTKKIKKKKSFWILWQQHVSKKKDQTGRRDCKSTEYK